MHILAGGFDKPFLSVRQFISVYPVDEILRAFVAGKGKAGRQEIVETMREGVIGCSRRPPAFAEVMRPHNPGGEKRVDQPGQPGGDHGRQQAGHRMRPDALGREIDAAEDQHPGPGGIDTLDMAVDRIHEGGGVFLVSGRQRSGSVGQKRLPADRAGGKAGKITGVKLHAAGRAAGKDRPSRSPGRVIVHSVSHLWKSGIACRYTEAAAGFQIYWQQLQASYPGRAD